jgi:hypothetical protein
MGLSLVRLERATPVGFALFLYYDLLLKIIHKIQ